MSQTIAEKIISSHCGQAAYAGQTVVASIDLAMATDGSGPLTIELFHQHAVTFSFCSINLFNPLNSINHLQPQLF